MNMTPVIRYFRGGSVFFAERSNEDIEIIVAENDGRKSVTIVPKTDIELDNYSEKFSFAMSKDALYFMNGYQTWTDTTEFAFSEKERDVSKLPAFLKEKFCLGRSGDAEFYRYEPQVLHGYDVFYAKGANEKFILNLNYKTAYLIIEVRRAEDAVALRSDFDRLPLAAGKEFPVADYFCCDTVAGGFEFFNSVFPKRNLKKIFGYTSWYNYYQNIDEKTVLRDLDGLDGRFNLFQIDDGFETKVGDWLCVDSVKFPNGLEPIVKRIHDKGLDAGIWLAPFSAEEESEIFKTRPDLFKKGADGKPIKCGSNWSGFYAFDMGNKEARDYIAKCLKFYVDMGFDFFKLDFLYAANFSLYPGMTRSQAAEKAYAFLRECLGDKMILGCGATLFNCIDRFDYCRIGPDVSLKFDDAWFMRFMHRERISTKHALCNTVFRSFMDDRFFGNDPDVFLLRDDNISLSKQQRLALATMNALFGSVLMTSDNVGAYDDEKKEILAQTLHIFQNAHVEDYCRYQNKIKVRYSVDGEMKNFTYDSKAGVFING